MTAPMTQAEKTEAVIKIARPRGGTKWRVIQHPSEHDMHFVMCGNRPIHGHYSGHCSPFVDAHEEAIDKHKHEAAALRTHARDLARKLDEVLSATYIDDEAIDSGNPDGAIAAYDAALSDIRAIIEAP